MKRDVKKTNPVQKPEAAMTVADAVRKLRQSFGESQQAFAYRMQTAVRTIARWEAGKSLSLNALAMLTGLAQGKGDIELTRVFAKAFERGLGGDVPREVEDISADVEALHLMYNHPELADELAKWKRIRDRVLGRSGIPVPERNSK
jgi:DNA-binding transcriptional regulator YiaG